MTDFKIGDVAIYVAHSSATYHLEAEVVRLGNVRVRIKTLRDSKERWVDPGSLILKKAKNAS